MIRNTGVGLAVLLAGCATGSGGRVQLSEVPSTAFNSCEIPPGQPTWANVTLTGREGPFRGVWAIDGKVDSTDPQRAVPVPRGTRLEILVTLTRIGQTFRVQEFNRHGLVSTDSWTNTSMNGEICRPDGKRRTDG